MVGARRAPSVTAPQALSDHAGRYAYISSESVYRPPPSRGANESAPTVDGRPRRRGNLVPRGQARRRDRRCAGASADRSLLARSGTILGPYEDVGRLTWWLGRMARGGEILCPGPPDLPLQLVDARDLAAFAINAAAAGHSGPFNRGLPARPCHDGLAAPGLSCRGRRRRHDAHLGRARGDCGRGDRAVDRASDLAAPRPRVRRHARRGRRARPRRRPAMPRG